MSKFSARPFAIAAAALLLAAAPLVGTGPSAAQTVATFPGAAVGAAGQVHLAQYGGGGGSPPPSHGGPGKPGGPGGPGKPGGPGPASGPVEVDGAWRIIAVDREVLPEWARKDATMNFDRDGRVSGQAVCNTFSGRYNRRGSDIIIDGVASTRKFCDRSAEYENRIFKALEQVDRVETGENQTIVLSSKGTARLRLRRY
ncbi:META domain-containing protein [Acuticoccus sediminis]|nr:META domain-containing protein [Acuticoccus sediminis]